MKKNKVDKIAAKIWKLEEKAQSEFYDGDEIREQIENLMSGLSFEEMAEVDNYIMEKRMKNF